MERGKWRSAYNNELILFLGRPLTQNYSLFSKLVHLYITPRLFLGSFYLSFSSSFFLSQFPYFPLSIILLSLLLVCICVDTIGLSLYLSLIQPLIFSCLSSLAYLSLSESIPSSIYPRLSLFSYFFFFCPYLSFVLVRSFLVFLFFCFHFPICNLSLVCNSSSSFANFPALYLCLFSFCILCFPGSLCPNLSLSIPLPGLWSTNLWCDSSLNAFRIRHFSFIQR